MLGVKLTVWRFRVGASLGIRTRNLRIKRPIPLVHGVLYSPLTCGYVQTSSIRIAVSRPSIAEIVGRIMGDG